jgi:hypothetical protein
LILSLTAFAGFLTSFVLLHAGMLSMGWRYPLAISVAYGVFLFLLGMWLRLQRDGPYIDLSGLDLGNIDFTSHTSSCPVDNSHFGGGDDFYGGGAGGSWGQNVTTKSAPRGGSSADGFLSLDLDDGWLIVLAIVALAGALIATLYVVYIAPALLAELLVDGALVAGLYKRIKPSEQRHWLRGAMRQTVVPALSVILFFAVAGFALQKAIPGAHTMGEAWQMHQRHIDSAE